MIANYIKGIFELRPNNRYYKKHKKELGLSLSEFLRLKLYDHWYVANTKTTFYNKPFTVSSPYWFLQSIEEIFIHEVYKFETENPNPLIIDCGANWGLSVLYFKMHHPGAKILAYEADHDIYNLANENLKGFGFSDVHLFNNAIWNENGTLTFSSEGSVGGTITGLDLNSKKEDYADAPPGTWIGNYNTYYGVHKTKEREVKAVRLKDILKEHEKIDFLKIDIEGAEHKVVLDCADELHRVDKMFIEYHSSPGHPQLLDEILKVISNSGLRYYVKEASTNFDHPFIRNRTLLYDLQLNIFCFREDGPNSKNP